ncbi:hypothetical protein [Enterobacter cloacae complex sp. 301C7]|uniref:hypothetical protein n=1 Tax=Enterobacter cloacae complex sp. 301C7 TaxID=3395848 RepID=UPI003CE77564
MKASILPLIQRHFVQRYQSCERITVKEKQLLAIENSGEEKDIEKLRTELSDLYRQFIFM